MVIQTLPVDKLVPADYNPRKDLKPGDAEYEKLKRSLSEFGYVEPVIWNKTTGHVVGGHQRLKVLIDTGMTEVECVVVEMDDDKEKALNVALNKISGEWDKEKLSLLIADLQGADFDVSLTGFDAPELDALFKDAQRADVHDDDFDVDAALKEPAITKPGDLWLLGKHRLVCGDSTKREVFDLLMDGGQANLVVTDPPYNVNYEGSAGKIKNDNMADAAFYDFLLASFQNMETCMANDASIYVFSCGHGGPELPQGRFRRLVSTSQVPAFGRNNLWCWGEARINGGMSQVLFGWKKRGKHEWYADRKQTTIWEFDKPKQNTDHPTMKPVELLAYPILNSSMANCIVLDPFGGSGSTLIACEQTDRVCPYDRVWMKNTAM